MDKNTLWSVVRTQLSLDIGCNVDLLNREKPLVVEWRDLPGRRKYNDATRFLEIAIIDGALAVGCAAPLLPWAKEYFPQQQPEWLFQPTHLREIDQALAPYGYMVGDAHHYYLPTLPNQDTAPLGSVAWYEEDQLEQFRGNSRWQEALAFNPYYPDMLAVAALDDQGQPIAMAGASQDGKRMWQIGITVQPPYRGRGLAANLTALLKDELLHRDIVPFYGTATSHIFSQNVAIKAGFRPAFAYLYAKSKG